MPPPAHRPQATEVAGRPRRAPVLGQGVEEGVGRGVGGLAGGCPRWRRRRRTGRRRPGPGRAVSSSRCAAPPALAASDGGEARRGPGGRAVPASRTPGGVDDRGQRAGRRGIRASRRGQRPARSVMSQAATVTAAPAAASSAASAGAPGAAGPGGWPAPGAGRRARRARRARWAPMPPVPPVTSTVPRGCPRRRPGPAGQRRADQPAGEQPPVPRIATWSSPQPASDRGQRRRPRRRAPAGRSTRPPQRSGVLQGGDPAEAPDLGLDRAGHRVGGAGATAPRVSTHSGAASRRRPVAWTRARVWARPGGDRRVAGGGPSSRASSETTPARSWRPVPASSQGGGQRRAGSLSVGHGRRRAAPWAASGGGDLAGQARRLGPGGVDARSQVPARAARGRGRQRFPGDPVAPGRRWRLCTLAAGPPGGQGRDHAAQPRAAVQRPGRRPGRASVAAPRPPPRSRVLRLPASGRRRAPAPAGSSQ